MAAPAMAITINTMIALSMIIPLEYAYSRWDWTNPPGGIMAGNDEETAGDVGWANR